MLNLERTIKSIKKSGFGYVKVELEATLNRRNGGNPPECEPCEGGGRIDCDGCEGEGYLESRIYTNSGRDTGQTTEIECQDCYGDGTQDCDECEGTGQSADAQDYNFADENVCDQFIKDYVSDEARKALIFGMFYNDGSVDSEFTFTLPIEKAEYLVEYIEAFNKLAEENGGGMEVDGAGMHIAVLLKESDGRYPVPSSVRLEITKLNNFKQEVTKLLPALYVAACSGNFTREFGYRAPQVTDDKYSAINIFRGGFEYRVFETCYQRPEAIFEFLGTIARTLEYYRDPTKKITTLGQTFDFTEEESVDSFASTPHQIRIIKKQLKHVTPKGMSIKQLLDNREITLSVTNANQKYSTKIKRAKKLYREHVKAYKAAMAKDLNPNQLANLADMERYGYFGASATQDEKKARVLGLQPPEELDKFINSNIGLWPEYSVNV